MVTLLCPVRGCSESLTRTDRAFACPRGHSFDLARSGYCNLLQPQDRRSKHPGDSREAALARRRFLEAGHGDFLLQALLETIDGLSLPERTAVLDVGCGEGFYLGSLARERRIEGHGIDLSVPAIDLAARRWPEVSWFVVNADRRLPYAEGSFDLLTSLTARRNSAEYRRVLSPEGRLLVAVPGEDDLIELREAVLGERVLKSRLEGTLAAFAGEFELESHRTLRRWARLNAAAIRDVLASTYRGARESERKRIEGLDGMEVTMSLELVILRSTL
ncbi:MAG TPA: methyltransferase domain-containing protein [Thermoanaerobaculia bacterium]